MNEFDDNVFIERNLHDESLSDHPGYASQDHASWTDNLEDGKTKGATATPVNIEDSVGRLNYLWVLISCGYMVSWTSIGSLISYFKARQGANFYVKLYCAFYLPGLPVSLFQQRYDEKIDEKVGSANAFMARVCVGMAFKIGMLFFIPFVPEMFPIAAVPNVMLLSMVVLGAFSWMCHGTACQLCSMFPASSTAFLQTGFRTPEIYTVVMVSALHLGSDAKEANIIAFFYITAIVVGVGTVSWIIVARSKPALHYFALKDETYAQRRLSTRSTANAAQSAEERSSLLGADKSAAHTAHSDRQACLKTERSDSSATGTGSAYDSRTGPPKAAKAVGSPAVDESKEFVAAEIRPCRVAIFLNIWSSIFSAAFFAYVRPASKSLDTEVILYFVRLFSDLVGRPLARLLPRPSWLQTKHDLVRIAAIRLSLMAVFFAYIAFDWFPKNDAFIIALVCLFSVLSGYLAVLSYEYAAAELETKAGQSMAGALMNSTFQMSAFTAVIMGVIVSELGVFTDPSEGGDGDYGDDDILEAEGDLWPEKERSEDDTTDALLRASTATARAAARALAGALR